MRKRKLITFELGGREWKYYLPPDIDEETLLKDTRETFDLITDPSIDFSGIYVDVGARDGDSLFPFLAAGAEKCIAFEPSDEIEWLCRNREINDAEVLYHSFAISDREGPIKFVWDENGRNGGIDCASSRVGEWDGEREFPSYPYRLLPEMTRGLIESASFIKIDTEGSDIVVLNEFRPAIEKSRPVIMVENWPFTQKLIVDFADSIDYNVFNMRLEPMKFDTHNLILLPR